MAYGAGQDICAPCCRRAFARAARVLRINAEVRDKNGGALEFNTAAEKADNRGWVNIGRWDVFLYEGRQKDDLHAAGADDLVHRRRHRGRLPCGKGQRRLLLPKDGTFTLVPAEKITANKEFCDCKFAGALPEAARTEMSAFGKMLPAIPEEETTHYEKAAFTVENAAVIPCMQVLNLSGDVRAPIFAKKGFVFLPALLYCAVGE